MRIFAALHHELVTSNILSKAAREEEAAAAGVV